MSLIHLARQGFITKSALPSVTRTRGASYQPSLLLLGEGTNGSTSITDSSQNALAVTVGGNAQISTAQKPTGMTSSIAFDGNGDYLRPANNAGFQLGTGDFTLETYIYVSSFVNSGQIYDFRSSANNNDGLSDYFSSSGSYNLWINNSTVFTSTNLLSTNTWYHIAITRSGTSLRVFFNGVQQGSTVTNSTNFSSQTFIAGGNFFQSASWLNGYISNLRIVKGTALYTKNFFVPTLPLSTFAQQKAYPDLLLLGSGTNGSTTITDSSPNAFTITRNGDTNISTAQYPVGMTSSIYFDGTGDYLSIASNAAFTFGSGDFTVECYIYFVSYTQYAAIVGVWTGTTSTSSWLLTQGETSSSKLRFGMSNGSSATFNETSGGISLNNWLHLAVTRQSNTLLMFVNGVQLFSGTMSQNNSPSSVLTVGSVSDGSFTSNCYISNLRITKGTALYTGKFNVPLLPLPSSSTSPGASPSLYITGDGINNSTNIIDRSPNAFTVTVNGDTKISTAQEPTGMVSSIYFDGTGDYLSVANNAALQAGTGNFTLEAWIYRSAAGSAHTIYAKGGSSTGMNFQVTSTNVLRFTYATSNIDSTGTIPATSWTHVAVVREGTGTNQTKLYINGVNDGQGTVSTDFNQTEESRVGTNRDAGENFNGYISNVRFTKGTALYTATFVPPPLPILLNSNQIAYPSLLLRGAGANNSTTFTDSSPNAYTITRTGDVIISTAQYPTGMSSSIYFDGTGDYLVPTSNNIVDFGTGDFTIECWIYLTSLNADRFILDARSSNSQTQCALQVNSTNYATFVIFDAGGNAVPLVTSTSTVSQNTWTHIAVSRYGTSLKLFFNGTEQSSATNSTNFTQGTNRPVIGATGYLLGYNLWIGYLSNLRIVKGTALYRSNFTPPPLPASATPQTDLTPTTTASSVTNNVYGVYQLA